MAGLAHPWHLKIAGRDYRVATDEQGMPVWRVDRVPAIAGTEARLDEVPISWRTFHYGFGFSESSVPGCYDYADNMDCRWPGLAILGPLVTTVALTDDGTNRVKAFFEENSQIYVLKGRYCQRIAITNGTTPSDDQASVAQTPDTGADGIDFGSGTPALLAQTAIDFAGKTYIGFGNDTPVYSFNGTTWSNDDPTPGGSDTTVRLQYAAKDYLDGAGGGAAAGWRLWSAYGTNSVSGCLAGNDPLDSANWATAWTVGDTSHGVTGLVSVDYNALFVAKTNGLYTLDATGRHANVLQSVEFLVDGGNGINTIADGALIYYPHLLGLPTYDARSGDILQVQPGGKTGNRSAVRGIVTAQTIGGEWHYVALYNGTDSYLLAGRFPSGGEAMPPGWVGPKIWHPLAKLTGVRCDAMFLSGLTDPPRLWFGHGENAAFIRLPKSGNVIAELGTGGLRFASSGSLYLSPHDWDQPGLPKELLGFELENEDVSATNYVDLYVSLDGGGWNSIGRAEVRGRSQFYLPASGNWRANRVVFRLDCTNATSTATIKIKPLTARASIRAPKQEIVTTAILLEDDLPRRDGGTGRRSAQTMLDDLAALEDAGRVTLVDWWQGKERQRSILVHRVQETLIGQPGDKAAHYAANLTFAIVRSAPAAWRWDSGVLWDSGIKWT